MTSIEVPDWVVEIGAEAISKRHLSNTGMPFPIAACREDARSAITAALGAWVVPTACAEPWRIDYLNSYPQNSVEVSTLDTLYPGDVVLLTLRQEKPE
jgi:hypothetical protein